MFQNSKRIRSGLFTGEIRERLDFLGSSVLFLASGYQGPGFHFVCHVAFSADSLTRACGNRALLSIYTALCLHKDIFSCLRNEHGDSGFLSLPVFAFAQIGIIFLEVTKGAGTHCSPPCSRDCSMLVLWQRGPHVCAFRFPTLPAVAVKGFLNSTSHPISHIVLKSHPSRGLGGSFQPTGSQECGPRPDRRRRRGRRTRWKCRFSGPAPDPPHQKIKGRGPAVWVLAQCRGDSDAS